MFVIIYPSAFPPLSHCVRSSCSPTYLVGGACEKGTAMIMRQVSCMLDTSLGPYGVFVSGMNEERCSGVTSRLHGPHQLAVVPLLLIRSTFYVLRSTCYMLHATPNGLAASI
jgi:hypothetical protein